MAQNIATARSLLDSGVVEHRIAEQCVVFDVLEAYHDDLDQPEIRREPEAGIDRA